MRFSQSGLFNLATATGKRFSSRWLFVAFSAIILSGCTSTNLFRQTLPFEIPSSRYVALIMKENGQELHSVRPDDIRFPASLTKMMTLYLAFEAMKSGKMTRETLIPISQNASRQPASKLYFKPGSTIKADIAIQALAVKSANDVATAVAEHLGGTEANFARIMTSRARSLGMASTTFRNASGLPDKQQVTTARDMAKLGVALRRNFPQYYYYFGKTSFVFRGRTIRGHNRVLTKLKGSDGIKTGYTRASGYNLVTSARTRKGRVIGVIMGENSGRVRDKHMLELIKAFGS